MPVPMRIDFVSDIVCPWCAVGLCALEEALRRLAGQVDAELHFQPFELNPAMPREGQEIVEHLSEKYGIGPEQIAANARVLRQRGAEVGFEFREGARTRTYNSFDAHRLLHWAAAAGQARKLKHGLLRAYFTEGKNIADHAVLAQVAAEAGLDGDEAQAILADGKFAAEVRDQERQFTGLGITAVPSVIVNGRHLIQGGQPPDVFERALARIAGAAAA